jgi:hypothetical protein
VASFESEKFASAENAIGEQNAMRRPDPYRKIGRSAASRFVVETACRQLRFVTFALMYETSPPQKILRVARRAATAESVLRSRFPQKRVRSSAFLCSRLLLRLRVRP